MHDEFAVMAREVKEAEPLPRKVSERTQLKRTAQALQKEIRRANSLLKLRIKVCDLQTKLHDLRTKLGEL